MIDGKFFQKIIQNFLLIIWQILYFMDLERHAFVNEYTKAQKSASSLDAD